MGDFSKASHHYLLSLESNPGHIMAMRNLAGIAKGNSLISIKSYISTATRLNRTLLNDLDFVETIASLGTSFSALMLATTSYLPIPDSDIRSSSRERPFRRGSKHDDEM